MQGSERAAIPYEERNQFVRLLENSEVTVQVHSKSTPYPESSVQSGPPKLQEKASVKKQEVNTRRSEYIEDRMRRKMHSTATAGIPSKSSHRDIEDTGNHTIRILHMIKEYVHLLLAMILFHIIIIQMFQPQNWPISDPFYRAASTDSLMAERRSHCFIMVIHLALTKNAMTW